MGGGGLRGGHFAYVDTIGTLLCALSLLSALRMAMKYGYNSSWNL